MNDENVIDKIKNALGFGEDEEDLEADRAIEMERPLDSLSPERDEPIGQVDGAASAAAQQGISGGMGASGAMGGAGSAGPAGVTGFETDDAEVTSATTDTVADPGDVRTEYEMGHEPLPPGHDEVAESGVTRAPEDRVQP